MIRLFYNYYEDKNPYRRKEINFCLQKNLENKYINTIVIETPGKPSYNFFFNKINAITGPEDINIIANSDIFFDETICHALNMGTKDMYALLRWDWHSPTNITYNERGDSQDTWVVKGRIENVMGDFTLGMRGCDNRIAHEFHKAGYRVTNPSLTIKSYHVHNSNIRNYTFTDLIPGPYLTLPPTRL